MDVTSIIHLLEHYVMQMMLLYYAMIGLCEIFAQNFDITFNYKKKWLHQIWSKTYWL